MSTWDIWQKKYLEPAFDKNRHEEMIKNFGYVSLDKHDFELQYKVYDLIKEDNRLNNEIRRFIGFLAGTNFFERYKITVKEWFAMKNWSHPERKNDEGRTINEILDYKYGINMLKVNFPQMACWKRF